MKKLLLPLLLLLPFFIGAQNSITTCWDFDAACATPEYPLSTGCVLNALPSSGTPDILSDHYNITAVSGRNYLRMLVQQCLNEAETPRGEGLLLQHNFVAGRTYELKFHVRYVNNFENNPQLDLYLLNNLPANGGPEQQGICNDAWFVIPDVPSNAQEIAAYNAVSLSSGGWQEKVVTFTAGSNSNQLWFRPSMNPPEILEPFEFATEVFLDQICVRDITCLGEPFTVDLCRPNATPNQILVTINGAAGVPQSAWKLISVPLCSQYTIGFLTGINWQSSNSFLLPANTDCYLIGYNVSAPGCNNAFIRQEINTNDESIPLCSPPCIEWDITVTDEPCNSVFFKVTPAGNFANGTSITATLNGVTVGQSSPGMVEYYPILQGDNRWITVCFTVTQPGCKPQTYCKYWFIPDCGLEGRFSESDRNSKAALRVSNPSDAFISLSYPIENGTAQLFNLQGSLIKSFNLNGSNYLEVAEVPNGQYMLSIQQAGSRENKLVLIMHQP